MNISVKTKLVMVWTVTLLLLGGIITVSVWHTKPPKPVMSKQVATQAAQETPQKSLGYLLSKQNPSVTPVQKSANQAHVTDSVETEEPIDDEEKALLALLMALEKQAELKEDEPAIATEMEEELTEADIQAKVDSIVQEIYDKAEEYRSLKPRFLELVHLPQTSAVTAEQNWLRERKYVLQGHGEHYPEGIPRLVSLYYQYTKDKVAFEPGGWINALGVGRFTIGDPAGEEGATFALYYSPTIQ